MALIPATITVSFTAQYTGLHNVYFKLSTDISYGLAGQTNCTVGNSCSFNFQINVDNETCDTLTYDIYVQPICFITGGVSPVEGRVSEQIQFIPEPACKKYTFTCEEVGVDTVTGTLGGQYDVPNLVVPVQATVGGAVFDITFDNLVNGAITVVTVTDPGSYTSGDLPIVLDWAGAAITEDIAADLVFNLLDCVALNQTGCSGLSETITAGLALDATIEACSTIVPGAQPAGYATPVENGNCLCDCTQYTITEDTGTPTNDLTVNYVACNGTAVLDTIVAGDTLGPICMVTDSLVVTPLNGATSTILVGVSCNGVVT
jgi:hypothetical protein